MVALNPVYHFNSGGFIAGISTVSLLLLSPNYKFKVFDRVNTQQLIEKICSTIIVGGYVSTVACLVRFKVNMQSNSPFRNSNTFLQSKKYHI